MTEQALPDPELNVQGEDPVIPDEGIDAVPPELVASGTGTDSERPVDETLSDRLEGGAASERDGAPALEPNETDGR
ncbi:hypothetical protein ACFQ36_04610 [Arthrobacter sp. GCM10027362]|uniref:hypothetical protein n=1 Tax=Arthrobacter sp. GCM10027362 TaxID=3273379 RepID=UPI00363E44AC